MKAIRRHVTTVMDVHLMIAPVDPYIDAFAEAGADVLTAHLEAGPHVHRTLQAIRAAGAARRGSRSTPEPRSRRRRALLDLCDLVCVMTVKPRLRRAEVHPHAGGSGPAPACDDRRPADPYRGGWRDRHTTAPLVRAAGADVLVAGSAVFRGGSVESPEAYGANIRAIRAAAR